MEFGILKRICYLNFGEIPNPYGVGNVWKFMNKYCIFIGLLLTSIFFDVIEPNNPSHVGHGMELRL